MVSSPTRDPHSILVLRAHEVEELLDQRETELIDAVRRAYLVHAEGRSSLPHSTFLRFPDDSVNRIIALPAYLGDGFAVAGMKWIASFPGNLDRGMERASAVLVLNSCETGRPRAIVEGSIISARRTAASAALAASALCPDPAPEATGLVGAGPINFETARFLCARFPRLSSFGVFDLNAERAAKLVARVETSLGREAVALDSLEEVLRRHRLVAFATNATEPHVEDLSSCPPGTVILHTSLRDVSPGAILAADNVVDDPDHVCRARTSVHLAAEQSGSRAFIRAPLAAVLEGTAPPKQDPGSVTVFSPFGLGVLDLAVGHLTLEKALAVGAGTEIPEFFPLDRKAREPRTEDRYQARPEGGGPSMGTGA